jgi:hypothetical protein
VGADALWETPQQWPTHQVRQQAGSYGRSTMLAGFFIVICKMALVASVSTLTDFGSHAGN